MRSWVGVFAVGLLWSACSSAPKNEPVLSELEGQKIALVNVEGTPTAKKVVTVALINQLSHNGTFILIPQRTVVAARTRPDMDPRDTQAIAKAVGAQWALEIKVAEFSAEDREGVSTEKRYDSLMAKERGEDQAEVEHLYKVKSLEGKVELELTFTELATGSTRRGNAEATDKVLAGGPQEAPILPPRLRFLEKLAEKAFQSFFEKYN